MGIEKIHRHMARGVTRGVMICYDDAITIRKTVDSLAGLVDEIVAVDGRYIDFPGTTDYSTDGTREYLRESGVRIIDGAGLLEADKRNLYLIGEPGDWYLHLDADEEWKGPLIIPDADMGIVKLRRAKPVHTMLRVRLFKHVEGIHYEKKHYWLHDGQGRTFALLDKPGKHYKAEMLPDNLIVHWEDERLPKRNQAKRQYYRILYKRENRIREVL